MYKKICPSCETISYSITVDEIWLCPNCQHDITSIEAINFLKDNDTDAS